jgi:DNA primase catalytic core
LGKKNPSRGTIMAGINFKIRTMDKYRDLIDKIHDIPIRDIIAEYTTLTKAGVLFKGKCPFPGHDDKHATNFFVNVNKNTCYCYACNRGGDVITTTQLIKGYIKPRDAIEDLAAKYNFPLPEYKEPSPEEQEKRKKAEEFKIICEAASRFYFENLKKPKNKIHLDYVLSRTTPEMVDRYEIGYADLGWTSLYDYLRSKGFKKDIIISCGLAKEKNKKVYDFFRGRIMFPIVDRSGSVVGFSGRILPDENSHDQAKYINSPETEIYHKDKILFGLTQARNAITKNGFVYIVEGNPDVLCLSSIGVENTVSPGGTALTDGQLIEILRYTNNLVLIPDGDTAGIKAVDKWGQLAIEHGFNCYVIVLPFKDGIKTDPDSFFKNYEIFESYKKDHYQDYIYWKTTQLNVSIGNEPAKKLEAIREISKLIVKYSDKSRREVYEESCSKIIPTKQLWKTEIDNLLKEKTKNFDEISRKKMQTEEIEFNVKDHFWDIEYLQGGGKKASFNYLKLYNYLISKGYYRLKKLDGEFIFVQEQSGILEQISAADIKDFIINLIRRSVKEDLVLNMIFRGSRQYLGPESLSNLNIKSFEFISRGRGYQYLFFKNEIWKISADKIEQFKYGSLSGYVWHKKIIDFDIKLEEPIFNAIRNDNGDIDLVLNENHNCEFLQFLINTSNVLHKREEKSEEEKKCALYENLINKFSAIGYLLHTYRDDSKTWCVIAMDYLESEVGESRGGTGKSMLGTAISQVLNTTVIEGKNKKLTEDKFIWQNVDEYIELIYVDDVRQHLDFEFFYPVITGQIRVEQKGLAAWSLPRELTPKLLITTNHSVSGSDESSKRRQFKIAFSDYYGKDKTPAEEFGHTFFSKEYWPSDQWNAFYNVLARCIQFYLKYGKIEIVTDNLEKRRIRQSIGESFLEWAQIKFIETEENLNIRHMKSALYEELRNDLSSQERSYMTPHKFKSKLKEFCLYASDEEFKYELNKDGDKKTKRILAKDGAQKTVEYITIHKISRSLEESEKSTHGSNDSLSKETLKILPSEL